MNTSFRGEKRACMLWRFCVAVLASLMIASIANAQRLKTPPPAKKGDDEKPPAAKKGDTTKRESARGNPDDRTKPQLVDLQTDDGVMIAATYFPPLRPGKDVPV